jgi:thiamine biosynthesis protein ThiC
MSSARQGQATKEMISVSNEERISLEILKHGVARGSIIIPKNRARKQEKVRIVGIGMWIIIPQRVNLWSLTSKI